MRRVPTTGILRLTPSQCRNTPRGASHWVKIGLLSLSLNTHQPPEVNYRLRLELFLQEFYIECRPLEENSCFRKHRHGSRQVAGGLAVIPCRLRVVFSETFSRFPECFPGFQMEWKYTREQRFLTENMHVRPPPQDLSGTLSVGTPLWNYGMS